MKDEKLLGNILKKIPGFIIRIVFKKSWKPQCFKIAFYNEFVLTQQPNKFITSKCLQNLAKHITALEVTCLHPFDIKLFSLGHPRAKASTPFSVILQHQLTLIWVRLGHPSLKAFSDISVIAAQLSKFSFWSLLQYLEKALHVESVNFLQPFRFRSSTLGHCWARVFIEPSAIDWHPLRDNCLRNPPHLLDMFSIIGPWKFCWNYRFNNKTCEQVNSVTNNIEHY